MKPLAFIFLLLSDSVAAAALPHIHSSTNRSQLSWGINTTKVILLVSPVVLKSTKWGFFSNIGNLGILMRTPINPSLDTQGP